MNTITNIYPKKTSVMFRARAIPKPLSMPIANNRPAFIGLEPQTLVLMKWIFTTGFATLTESNTQNLINK